MLTRYEQDSIDTIISQVDEAFVFVFLIFATEVELEGVSGCADIVGDALDELWVIRIRELGSDEANRVGVLEL